MILYHFSTSPYARRVRLVLAQKGIKAELRDSRANPEYAREVRELNPMGQVPVLVDDGRVIADSSVITTYLDRKVPSPPLWPEGMEGVSALEIATLSNYVIDSLVDLGMRCVKLHDHPKFGEVKGEFLGRVQASLARLVEIVKARGDAQGKPLCGDRFGGADIALFTMVVWLDGLAVRAKTFAPAKTMVELGWTLPPELVAWAVPHRARDDVRALDA